MKKILILGGSGFLGFYLINSLKKKNLLYVNYNKKKISKKKKK